MVKNNNKRLCANHYILTCELKNIKQHNYGGKYNK